MDCAVQMIGVGEGSQGRPAGAHHRAIDRCNYWHASLGYRFDGSLEDIFELQDKVAVSVAGVVEPTLQAAEIRRPSERR